MPAQVIVAMYGQAGQVPVRPEESHRPPCGAGVHPGGTVVSMPQLSVTIKQYGQVCVLSVSGELDIATVPILAGQAAVLHGLAGRLIVDLSGLEFVDCKGAQALAAVTSAVPPGCPVQVRGLAGRLRKVFDILALPLERHGHVILEHAEWTKLESQVLRSWARQARADSQALVARSRRASAARSTQQARDRAMA
jgi:anti-anti-sigma factor